MMDSSLSIMIEKPAEGIALLRLNRPDRLNALSQDAVRSLIEHLNIVDEDNIRVVVLTGEGRGFCAGWDLTQDESQDSEIQPPPGIPEYYAGQLLFAGMIKRLRALNKVVIAAVNGSAVGAGFGLALAADIRVAGRSAAFHVGAVRIGLTAGECGISYHLPRLIGASRAFEVMLTGRPITSDEAERIGLVSSVVDDAELLTHALDMAALVLRNSPYSTSHTKQLMWANLAAPSLDAAIELENHAQVLALMTEDFQESSMAFREKRPPTYRGR